MKDIRTIFEEIDELDDEVYEDDGLLDDMIDLLTDIDPESLTDDQADALEDIFSRLENYEDEEDVDEAMPARKIRRDVRARRKRSREYRRQRSRLKVKARRYRKSARGRLLAKKRKMMAKRGKTATGQRKRTYIN